MQQEIFITFPDLREHGISYCRVHLGRLMDKGEFPMAVRLSANRIAWRLSEVERWKQSRPAARQQGYAA